MLHNFATISAICKNVFKKDGLDSVFKVSITTQKVPENGVSSVLYFLVFELNTKIYRHIVFLMIFSSNKRK